LLTFKIFPSDIDQESMNQIKLQRNKNLISLIFLVFLKLVSMFSRESERQPESEGEIETGGRVGETETETPRRVGEIGTDRPEKAPGGSGL
jgi:hypothetical protein